MKNTVLLTTLLILTFSVGASYANSVVTVCGKDVWPGDPRTDFSEALEAAGRITFSCSGRIKFTKSHGFSGDTDIDGGGRITLDGEGHRMFGLGSSRGTRVSFRAIRLEGAGLGTMSIPGSVITGEGFVSLLDGTVISDSPQPVWLFAGDLTLRNASISNNAGPVLIVSEGELSITNSRLEDNAGPSIDTARGSNVRIHDSQFLRSGGALFGDASTTTPQCKVLITKSRFAGNMSATDGGAFASSCDLTIEETRFEHNKAKGSGGAILLRNGASATIRAAEFIDNESTAHGGAIVGLLEGRGRLQLRHVRFENNRASGQGGALAAHRAMAVDIKGGTFVNNRAGSEGGALSAVLSPVLVSSSLFLGNVAQAGGGIYLCAKPVMSRISNSIIARNSAVKAGGFFGQNTQFLNTTIVENGDVPIQHSSQCAHRSTIEFANTILHGGSSGACGGANDSSTFQDFGHNIQFPGSSCGTTIDASRPLLGLYFAPLRPFSPAAGRGNTQLCMAAPIGGRDIYGTHRPQGSSCSIGAVEGDLSHLLARRLRRRIESHNAGHP